MSSAEDASNREMVGFEGADKRVDFARCGRMKFSVKQWGLDGCSTEINKGIHQAGTDQDAQDGQQPIGGTIFG